MTHPRLVPLPALIMIGVVAASCTDSEPMLAPTDVSAFATMDAVYLDPHSRDDCTRGGWESFGFRNQGLCVQFVKTGKDSRGLPPLVQRLGALLWLDASAIAADDPEQVVDGAVVRWLDMSGNLHDATTRAGAPTLVDSALNGLPAVDFDGASYLATGNVTTEHSTTVFAVTRATDKWTTNWTYAHGVVNQYVVPNQGSIAIEILPRARAVQTWAAGAWTVAHADMTAWRTTTVRRDHTTDVQVFVDGQELAYRAGAAYPARTAPLRVGFTGDAQRFMRGAIAEIIIYNRALRAEERAAVEAYLRAKYGLS
jgi:hypothetical protein